MIRICETRNGNEKFIQNFGQKYRHIRDHLRGPTRRQEGIIETDLRVSVFGCALDSEWSPVTGFQHGIVLYWILDFHAKSKGVLGHSNN
jgi:hypothetical protein